MGGGSELFREGGAELYLVDDERSVLLQRGDFVVHLVRHVSSPLAAVVAMVGDMQWPVGKDSTVRKVGDGGFYFSNLPAQLRFAVSMENLRAAVTQKLETLFEKYSTYVQSASILAAGEFWTKLARNVDATVGSSVVSAQERLSGAAGWQGDVETKRGQRLAHRMQQAWRMSAVVKLLARSVERGAINTSTHIEKELRSGTAFTGSTSELVVASVDAVAKVMDAVETAGRMLLKADRAQPPGTSAAAEAVEAASLQSSDAMQQHQGLDGPPQDLFAVGSLSKACASSCWTLSKVGMRMLFATIVATMSRSGIQNPSVHASQQQQQPMSVTSDSACSDAAAASGRSNSTITSDPSLATSSQVEPEHMHRGGHPGEKSNVAAPVTEGGTTLPAWMRREVVSPKSKDDLHLGAKRVIESSWQLEQSGQMIKPPPLLRSGGATAAAARAPRQLRPASLPFAFYGPSTAYGGAAAPVSSTAPIVLPAAAAVGGSIGPSSAAGGFRVYRPQPIQPLTDQPFAMRHPSALPPACPPRPPHPRPHFHDAPRY